MIAIIAGFAHLQKVQKFILIGICETCSLVTVGGTASNRKSFESPVPNRSDSPVSHGAGGPVSRQVPISSHGPDDRPRAVGKSAMAEWNERSV